MRRDPSGNELLQRMYFKHGAYYYVYRNRWQLIGRTYNAALRGYAGLQESDGATPALIQNHYKNLAQRVKQGNLRQSSLDKYNNLKPRLLQAFSKLDPPDVTPSHIRQFIAHYFGTKPNTGNKALVILRGVFELGIELGLCEFNPAAGVKQKRVSDRTRRLTDSEFNRIRACAKGQLPLIMDVLYYTGQRIGDVLAIKQADMAGGTLRVIQQKTGEPVNIGIGPRLEQAIAAARSGPITGMWLFSKRGKPLSYYTVQAAFKAACARAGVVDTTLHDIRAKTITDMTVRGYDAQILAGHTDAKMTAKYIREKVAKHAESLDSLMLPEIKQR